MPTIPSHEDGVALLTTVAVLLVVSAVSAALLLSSSTDARIASAFQAGLEGRHAADAAAERALLDLAGTPDWSAALDGSVRSPFVDGPPSGARSLGQGARVDLDQIRNLNNCGHAGACTDAELDAVTAERPWGSNNPRWQLFAYGQLAQMSTLSRTRDGFYVVVLVADDAGETDGQPAQDAASAADPGHGIIVLRAEAFGPTGARHAVELTVERRVLGSPGTGTVRVLAWKRVD